MVYVRDMDSSYANLANIKLLEELYEKWIQDPSSVDPSWQNFFDGMQFGSNLPKMLPQRQDSSDLRVFYLIHAYRTYGHLMAHFDVLEDEKKSMPKELKLENFGLSDSDLDQTFPTGGFLEQNEAKLSEILEALENTYCRSIGIEYMDCGSPEIEKWIQRRIEPGFPSNLSNEERVEILHSLNQAEGFETFLHTKYVGQKRFSLEGAETFIPLMHAVLDTAGEKDVSDVVLGMAHRGRLNVLANIMGKSYSYIFEEFEDHFTPDLSESSGDVKYHMGFIGDFKTKNGKQLQITLSANPSHLESVNPVVEGGARALQEQKPKENQKEVVPILVHGDAAVAGQGVVYETMTMSKLNGYGTKGTIHVVINNQIGFTTYAKDGRSTRYCTDIAKAFGSPVLHVNGEDPEACVTAGKIAMELRQEFGCDVFIDLVGYRKYGHNEGDEPTFTQPLQYQIIRAKKTMRELHREHLVSSGVIDAAKAEEMEQSFKEGLSKILEEVKSKKEDVSEPGVRTLGKHLDEIFKPVETSVDAETLKRIGEKLFAIPEGVNVHSKIQRLLKERQSASEIDWGTGELLAYASLATEKIHVRLSGQDVRRGTFSHRHGLYVDQVSGDHYFPLSHLAEDQAPVDIFNSPLSEMGVLGFEFGYSLMYPKSLVLWEAQYGDFANSAQVIIDQYLSSSEMKWGHATNLTLLLPHGYEGTGPEHSSARMERYLQLCGDENMIIAHPTTPSQLFHLLRRQAIRELKKPLIVFTPKAYLRHPLCKSPLSAFSEGHFEEILDDPNPPSSPKRLILCSGKFYYELLQEREKGGEGDVLIRIEQLYPLNEEKLKGIFAKYPEVSSCLWVQEEHENMGAWTFIRPHLKRILEGKIPLEYIGRTSAASPAAGSHALHKQQHDTIIQKLKAKEATS